MTHLIQPRKEFLQAARRRIARLLGADPRRPWIIRAVSRVKGSWLIMMLVVLGFLWSHWVIAAQPSGIRHAGLAFLLQLLILAYLGQLSDARQNRHHRACSWWPFPEEAVVDLLLRQALVRGIWFACLGAVGFAAVASVLLVGRSPLAWGLTGGLIGLWVVPLGVLIDGATVRWRWSTGYHAAFPLVGLVCFFLVRVPPIRLWFERHGDAVALAMPSGWLVLPWADGLEGRASIRWVLLTPLALALFALPVAWRQLRAAARFRERTLFLDLGEIPENAPEAFVEQIQAFRADAQAAHRPGPTANADAILSRAFLISPLANPSGWVQRLVWRWWTPEQRIAAECMARGWNRGIRLGHRFGWASLACGWGALLMSKHSEGSQWIGVVVVSGIVAILTLVPWLSGFSQVEVVRMFPIRLQAVAAVRWKDTAVRSLVAVPVLVLAGMVAVFINGDPLEVGAFIGFQLALTPVVLSPLATLYGLLNPVRLRGASGAFLKVVVAVACLVNILSGLLQFLPVLGLITGALCLGLNAMLLQAGNRWLDACRMDVDGPDSAAP